VSSNFFLPLQINPLQKPVRPSRVVPARATEGLPTLAPPASPSPPPAAPSPEQAAGSTCGPRGRQRRGVLPLFSDGWGARGRLSLFGAPSPAMGVCPAAKATRSGGTPVGSDGGATGARGGAWGGQQPEQGGGGGWCGWRRGGGRGWSGPVVAVACQGPVLAVASLAAADRGCGWCRRKVAGAVTGRYSSPPRRCSGSAPPWWWGSRAGWYLSVVPWLYLGRCRASSGGGDANVTRTDLCLG
jgi:hypothetical protein